MPINQAFRGRSYPPSEPYAVTRGKIREFADAIGDPNPAYCDVDAAKALGHPDLVAPPTFPIVLTMEIAAQAVHDPELGVDYRRVVHGQQRFRYARPLFTGDEVVETLRIGDITTLGHNEVLSTEVELATTAGETVCTAYSALVVRP